MERQRPPRTGHPMIDNVLAALWASFAAINMLSPSIIADLTVAAGAGATCILTLLRIYEHLAGETITETLTPDPE